MSKIISRSCDIIFEAFIICVPPGLPSLFLMILLSMGAQVRCWCGYWHSQDKKPTSTQTDTTAAHLACSLVWLFLRPDNGVTVNLRCFQARAKLQTGDPCAWVIPDLKYLSLAAWCFQPCPTSMGMWHIWNLLWESLFSCYAPAQALITNGRHVVSRPAVSWWCERTAGRRTRSDCGR